MASAALAPLPTSQRNPSIDLARGIALLGIILVNARFFFWPFAHALDTRELLGADASTLDMIVWSLVEGLCTYRFISLFSILFGFGLALQVSRAAATGVSRWGPGLRRMGFLLALGFLHAVGIWYGDILFVYGLAGILMLAIANWSTRAIRRAFIIIACVMVAMSILGAIGHIAKAHWLLEPHGEPLPDTTLRGFDAISGSGSKFFESPTWIAGETVAFREGPWLDAFIFRSCSWGICIASAIFGWGWSAVMMMTFGMYALRTGLFGADASQRRRRIVARGLGFGIPCAILTVAPFWFFPDNYTIAGAIHTPFLQLAAILMPPAYACAIVEWGPRVARWIAAPIERAGRMTLTLYLCESTICTGIASWWGLAWFDTLSTTQATLTVIAVWVVLVVAANAWLARFSMGPMERLWRAVTYRRA